MMVSAIAAMSWKRRSSPLTMAFTRCVVVCARGAVAGATIVMLRKCQVWISDSLIDPCRSNNFYPDSSATTPSNFRRPLVACLRSRGSGVPWVIPPPASTSRTSRSTSRLRATHGTRSHPSPLPPHIRLSALLAAHPFAIQNAYRDNLAFQWPAFEPSILMHFSS